MASPDRLQRTGLVIGVCLLLVLAVIPSTVTATSVTNDEDKQTLDRVSLNTGVTPARNNTTVVRHRNPEKVQGDAGVGAVRRRLLQQAASHVRSGVVNFTQEDYAQAQELLGKGYNRTIQQYRTLADEDEGQVLQQLRSLQRAQIQYVNAVQRYRETLAQYRAVTSAGVGRHGYKSLTSNDGRVSYYATPGGNQSRIIARRLERLATRVNTTEKTFIRRLENVSQLADVSFRSTDEIRNTTDEILATQATIRRLEFTATKLEVVALQRRISFTDPLLLKGQLTTVDGTPLAERSVAFTIGNQRMAVNTDAQGFFSLEYRPTVVQVNRSAITLRYTPQNASVYLSTTTRLNVTIEQRQVSLIISQAPRSLRYGQQITVVGRIQSQTGDAGISLPLLTISVAGRRLGQTMTQANGSYTFVSEVPVGIPTGNRSLQVAFPLQNRAIAPLNDSVPVQIVSTPSRLSVSASQLAGVEAVVQARLTTVNGTVVPNQPVEILVNGSTVALARTNTNGSLTKRVVIPESIRQEGSAAMITVRFDGRGTNLAPAREQLSLTLSEKTSDNRILQLPQNQRLRLLVGGGIALLVLAGIAVARRRLSSRSRDEEERMGEFEGSSQYGDAGWSDAQQDIEALFEAARDRLEDGDPDGAVELAYYATRCRITRRLPETGWGTHWEFYRACLEKGSDFDESSLQHLQEITTRFEQAAFATESLTHEDAREVLQLADTIVDSASMRSRTD